MVVMERFKKHSTYSLLGDSMSREGRTTIELSNETRDRLKELGKKGETYEEIIKRLLKLAKQKEG
jgi:hypothetical protein